MKFNKQETLEESAKNYAIYNEQTNKAVQAAVVFSASWQQERSYSEEEVLEICKQAYNKGLSSVGHSEIQFGNWFTQFKKK